MNLFMKEIHFPSRKSVNVETSPQGYVTETLKLDPNGTCFLSKRYGSNFKRRYE